MQFNRYNSRVLVSFIHSSSEIPTKYEYFNDLQMAYLRIIEYIQQNPGDWDTILSFTQFANVLDEVQLTLIGNERCIGICSNTIQIITEYTE